MRSLVFQQPLLLRMYRIPFDKEIPANTVSPVPQFPTSFKDKDVATPITLGKPTCPIYSLSPYSPTLELDKKILAQKIFVWIPHAALLFKICLAVLIGHHTILFLTPHGLGLHEPGICPGPDSPFPPCRYDKYIPLYS